MTVATEISSLTLQGNGLSTVWNFPFKVPGATTTDQTNLVVVLVDTTVSPATVTVLGNNQYAAAGISTPLAPTDAFQATYPLAGAALVAGQFITAARALPQVQSTRVPNGSDFYGPGLEAAYDYLCMLIQQMQTAIGRSLQVSASDPGGIPAVLPIASERANLALLFDASGNPIAGAVPQIAVSAQMIAVVQAATIALARTALGLHNVAVETIGNGLQDDGAGNLLALLHGSCRFAYVDTTHCALTPYNGGFLRIAGKVCTIPAAGVSVTSAGLALATVFFAYARDANGDGVVDTIEFSGVGHSADTTAGNVGVQIKTGDNTRTLIGMVRTNGASAQFQQDNSQLGVLSWFNRRDIVAAVAVNASSISGAAVPLGATITFLTWGDEVPRFDWVGFATASVVLTATTYIDVDAAAQTIVNVTFALAGGTYENSSHGIPVNCPEGVHTFYVAGNSDGTNGVNWVGGEYVKVRG